MASTIESLTNRLKASGLFLLVIAILLGSSKTSLADVNPDGSFSHSIPIRMPEGINGVQPNLAISYRSNAGNGMLGIGFHLSGLPVITRMNYGEGINYDDNDTFISQEGRLVHVGGNTYRAESDRATVYEVTTGTGGPDSWIARDRNGNTWYYGATTSSQILAVGQNGAVRVWALNKFEDMHGNYYTITYDQDSINGDYYPLLISYTKNDLAGSSDFSIEFATEPRNDAAISYQQSAKVQEDRRISTITVKAGTETLYAYALNYEEGTLTNQSKLSSLVLTAGTTNPITQTHSFQWDNKTLKDTDSSDVTTYESPLDWGVNFPNSWMQGDFNGDGLSDFMYLTTADTWVAKFGKKDGGFTTISSITMASVLGGSSILDWGRNMPYTWIKGEFNGDGRTDFMVLDSDATTPKWHVMVSNGDGTFTEYYNEAQSTLTPKVLDWGSNFPNAWQVGDFNGDRLTDFMYLDTDGNWNMQLAKASGGFASQTSQPSTGTGGITLGILDWGSNFPNSWIKGDFNGDGRQDFMYLDTNDNWQVRLSLGDGTFKAVNAGNLTQNNAEIPVTDVLDWGRSFPKAWLHGDFNGDGKQDFMYQDTTGAWQQILAKGKGQFVKAPSNLNTTGILDWGANFPNSWLVADLNGDYKTDIRYLDTASKWQTRLSSGDSDFIDVSDDTLGPALATVLDWGRNFPNSWQLGNFTGTGKVDILVLNAGTEESPKDRWNGTINANGDFLLTKITNPEFDTISVAYKSIFDFDGAIDIAATTCGGGFSGTGYGQPCGIPNTSPRFLVEEVQKSDGRSATGNNTLPDVDDITRYTYTNGRIYPGAIQESQSLGFESIKETQHAFASGAEVHLSTLITEYRQDGVIDFGTGYIKSPFASYPVEFAKTVQVDGVTKAVQETVLSYNDDQSNLYPVTGNTKVRQVLLNRKLVSNYQGGVFANKVIEDHGYDVFGRRVELKTCVVEDTSATGIGNCLSGEVEQLVTTFETWSPGNTWPAENPDLVTKTVDSKIISKIDLDYNTNHLKQTVSRYLICEDVAECSGNGWIAVNQDITYTEHGLISQVKDANNNTISISYDTANPGLETSKTQTDSTNQKSYTITTSYYPDGMVQQKRDVNDQPVSYEYDALNRVTKVTNALGGVVRYAYSDGDPDAHSFYKKTTTSEQVDMDGTTATKSITEYHDSLGTAYKTETFSSDNPGKRTIVENTRDVTLEGKVITKVSKPYFNDTTPEIHWETATTDQFGRKERIDFVDSSYVRYEYDVNEVRKITTHENEAGEASETVARTLFDKKGRLDKKYDQFNNLTDYTFDDANRVTRVDLPVDENYVVQSLSIKWDSFNRRTSLNDPSLGLTRYKYDNNSNPVEQIDKLGRKTTFVYDGLNRPVSKTVNDGTSDTIEISYTYDSMEIGDTNTNFPNGRLTKVEDGTGTHLFAYDQLGKITTTVKDITNLGIGFTEKFTYNQFGIPLQYEFPDGSIQKIAYSGMGSHTSTSLQSPTGAHLAGASFSDFNADQQMGYKLLDNGLKTEYSYTTNGYLKSLQTCRISGCSGSDIQNVTYEFYDYGMVKSITDNRDSTSKSVVDGNTDGTQHFVYDEIGRLIKAFWGDKTNPTEVIEYAYNSIGNQTERSSTVFDSSGEETKLVGYVYEGQKVISGFNSEVHHIDNQVFAADYDAYGNMSSKTTQDASGNEVTWNYLYDDENRLVTIYKNAVGELSNNTPITQFTYDYKGQRVKKLYTKPDGSGTVTTWYVSPTFEIRVVGTLPSTTTKYLQLSGKGKISSVTAAYEPTNYAMFESHRYYQYAGMISTDSLDSLVDKTHLYFMAFASHPASGKAVRNAIQIGFILIFLVLVWLTWRKREEQRHSSFKLWQRLSALPVVLVFFLASCQPAGESSSQASTGGYTYYSDSGEVIDVPGGLSTMSINGSTVDGIPRGTFYYHTDHLGSSTVITNEYGIEITRFSYNPFGEIVQHRSHGDNVITHKFTSQELDEESGLMYYNARFYDPKIGRFMTADTIVPDPTNAQTFNRYSYVINNPVKYTDPTGHVQVVSEGPDPENGEGSTHVGAGGHWSEVKNRDNGNKGGSKSGPKPKQDPEPEPKQDPEPEPDTPPEKQPSSGTSPTQKPDSGAPPSKQTPKGPNYPPSSWNKNIDPDVFPDPDEDMTLKDAMIKALGVTCAGVGVTAAIVEPSKAVALGLAAFCGSVGVYDSVRKE